MNFLYKIRQFELNRVLNVSKLNLATNFSFFNISLILLIKILIKINLNK